MKIGMLSASMSRRAGGLFAAIRDLSATIEQEGHEVEVFTVEDAFSSEDRQSWGITKLNVLPLRGPSAFGYQVGLMRALRDAKIDLLHVHGIWMYPSIGAIQWSSGGGPRMISPHGMLDPWALRHSSAKKRIASWLYENAHLRGARCIHALCDAEKEAIRAYGLKAPIAVIPNGVDPRISEGVFPAPKWAEDLPKGCRILLFMGRIHTKKGLSPLLEAMAMVRHRGNSEDWRLVIAGWDDGGHQAQLEAQVEGLGLGDVVRFIGPQFGDDKLRCLASAQAFILPSLSEGLPMAVLEAWAFGLPVLMSRECHLPEGFNARAALEIGTTPHRIAPMLEMLREIPAWELTQIGQNGRNLVSTRFAWSAIGKKMAKLYSWTLSGGSAPDFLSDS